MPESLTDTMQRYLRRYSTILRPNTIRNKHESIQSLIRCLTRSHPEIRSWNQLQRSHIDEWLQHLLYLSPNTRIMRIQYTSRFFYDMTAWQWPQAPSPDLITPQDLPPRPHILPKPLPPSVDQTLQKALASIHTLTAYGLRLLRLTGMRTGEMVDLSVHALTEVNASQFTLRVPIGKTREERIIPISAEAVSLIHAILAQRGRKRRTKTLPHTNTNYLMINESGRWLTRQSYWLALKKIAQQIPATENIYPHRLRHTFATEMARGGMSVPALMKILGHRTPEMTIRYVEVANTELQYAYFQAISQLKMLNGLQPTVSAPLSSTTANSKPPLIADLITTIIKRLECVRRDTNNTQTMEELHRFIKRIRKARDDLKKIL